MKLPTGINGAIITVVVLLVLLAVIAYFGYEHWSTLQD